MKRPTGRQQTEGVMELADEAMQYQRQFNLPASNLSDSTGIWLCGAIFEKNLAVAARNILGISRNFVAFCLDVVKVGVSPAINVSNGKVAVTPGNNATSLQAARVTAPGLTPSSFNSGSFSTLRHYANSGYVFLNGTIEFSLIIQISL